MILNVDQSELPVSPARQLFKVQVGQGVKVGRFTSSVVHEKLEFGKRRLVFFSAGLVSSWYGVSVSGP